MKRGEGTGRGEKRQERSASGDLRELGEKREGSGSKKKRRIRSRRYAARQK